MSDIGDIGMSIIFGVMIGLILGGGYFFRHESCQQKGVSFEEAQYGLFSGCLVKHNGKWLPLDNIRGFDDKG